MESGEIELAIGTHRVLFSMIEEGKPPDWSQSGTTTKNSFYGWGLLNVPERKINMSLSKALKNMGEVGKSLDESTARYAAHNDRMSRRKSVPPKFPRCPRCAFIIHDDFDGHVKRCKPWNTLTTKEKQDIEAENARILNPTQKDSFSNPAHQYGTCVEELGVIQARLVSAPPLRDVQALTKRAARLLELINEAATGL